ncbi:hypothetical protein DBR26_20870, partial [Pseudomonas sp. HMWF007]
FFTVSVRQLDGRMQMRQLGFQLTLEPSGLVFGLS